MTIVTDLKADLDTMQAGKEPDKGAAVVVKFIGFVAQLIVDSVTDEDDAKSFADELKQHAKEIAQAVVDKIAASQPPPVETAPPAA